MATDLTKYSAEDIEKAKQVLELRMELSEITDNLIEMQIKLNKATERTIENRFNELERIRDQLAALKEVADKEEQTDFARRARKNELAKLQREFVVAELEYLEMMLKKGKEVDEQRLENLRNAAEGVDLLEQGAQRANQLMEKGADQWEQKFTVNLLAVQKLIADGNVIGALTNQLSKLSQAGIMKVVGGI